MAIITVALVVCAVFIVGSILVILSMRSEELPPLLGTYGYNDTSNKTINEGDRTENGFGSEIADNAIGQQNVNGQNNTVNEDGTQLPELPNLPATARLAFVGDIMVHRWQLDAARVAPGHYDFNYKFRYIAPYIQAADFAIGNLETTLVRGWYSCFPLFRTPRTLADALVNAGFDMVTTGNNHTFDAGVEGVRSTVEFLTEAGLAFTGTYLTPECRDNITLVEVNGFTFAMINYTMHMNGINMGAYDFMVRIIYHDLIDQSVIDYEMIAESIARARALNPDFVVVLPHIGIEYYGTGRRQWGPGGHQWDTFNRFDSRWFNWMRTIHFFLESGADIVMSHHPHTLLPAEFVYVTDPCGTVRRTFVAYSMANFVSSQRTLPRETSAVFYLDFARDTYGAAYIAGASYVPIWVRAMNPLKPAVGADSTMNCFTVMPVTSTLRRVETGDRADLRDQDIERMRQVHFDVTYMLSGAPIPIEQKQDEYAITRSRRIDQFPGLPLWGSLPWY